MLLGPDLLSAVLGWDCHTHRPVLLHCRGASSEHCTDVEKADEMSRHGRMFEDGPVSQRPLG